MQEEAKNRYETNARKRYRFLALGALLTLLLFILSYLGFATWLMWNAWEIFSSFHSLQLKTFLIASICVILSIFLFKALFFHHRIDLGAMIELTEASQPELFKFIYQIADHAQAPRPHQVYLSPHVNAAVFYPLSLINLFFPTKKNLEIGAGLVTLLNKSEFEAVLAHEFGHFTQKSIAIDKWVYIGHQVASNIIFKRDKFDHFLNQVSNFDIRIAWIGWGIQIMVWAVRTLTEVIFSVVIMSQRALSRERELHADLVAARVAGSDAVVHSLYRLQAGEDAWQRAVQFGHNELTQKKAPKDLFVVQAYILRRMGEILQDANHGKVPTFPDIPASEVRLFNRDYAQPPKMWMTHPLNYEREENVKQNYVPSEINTEQAWSLFLNARSLRERLTRALLQAEDGDQVENERSFQRLIKTYAMEYFNPEYRGIYLNRYLTRHCESYTSLFNEDYVCGVQHLSSLYPEKISECVAQRKTLYVELNHLQMIERGELKLTDGELRFRDKKYQRADLERLRHIVTSEINDLEKKLQQIDLKIRSTHFSFIRKLVPDWEQYWISLLKLIHYAEHMEANVREYMDRLNVAYVQETQGRRVNEKGVQNLVDSANKLMLQLRFVFDGAIDVKLSAPILRTLDTDNWKDFLGELTLPFSNADNLGEWLNAISSWNRYAINQLDRLSLAAISELLATERLVRAHALEGVSMPSVPSVCNVPSEYDPILTGQDFKSQVKLKWWRRLLNRLHIVHLPVRMVTASSIIGLLCFFLLLKNESHLIVRNGLATPLVVQLAGRTIEVPALSRTQLDLRFGKNEKIETYTHDGYLVESFVQPISDFGYTQIYNVAGVSPIYEQILGYGKTADQEPQYYLGKKWVSTNASTLFTEPPKSIHVKGNAGSIKYLGEVENYPPRRLANLFSDAESLSRYVLYHLRFDNTSSLNFADWLYLGANLSDMYEIVNFRLKQTPSDTLLLRMKQDLSWQMGNEFVTQTCDEIKRLAANSEHVVDYQYLRIRCMPSSEQAKLFDLAHKKYSNSPWLNFATALDHFGLDGAQTTLERLSLSFNKLPAMHSIIASDLIRVARFQGALDNPYVVQILNEDRYLKGIVNSEIANAPDNEVNMKYLMLHQGDFKGLESVVRGREKQYAEIIRLASISDRATPYFAKVVAQWKDDEGITSKTIWALLGDAEAKNKPRDHLLNLIRKSPELSRTYTRFTQFIAAIDNRMSLAQAETYLKGMSPDMVGYACLMAYQRSPKHHKQTLYKAMNTLLLADERPQLNN